MKITVELQNGFLPDKYTKHCAENEKIDGNPSVSFPIKISGIPKGTKSLALTLLDDDAIPVCGFTYIHWVACNIDPEVSEIPENDSQSEVVPMTLGHNSMAGGLINESNPVINQHYVGPTPPDKTHDYQLTVYALDEKLPLENGFWLNDLKKQMQGHIIESVKVDLPVKN